MFIKLDIENIKYSELYLVSIVDYKLKTELPFFIAKDQLFAMNYFESWKRENTEDTKLCKIIKLPFINEKKD